jgi:hypothetical protein
MADPVAVSVYSLCALTSFFCAVLLIRAYAKRHLRLLLWSGVCFIGLALNNILVLVDVVVVPDLDLSFVRTIPAFAGVLVLVYGLVWEGL